MNISRSNSSSVYAIDTHPRPPVQETKHVTFGAPEIREFYSSDPPSYVSSPLSHQAPQLQRYLTEQLRTTNLVPEVQRAAPALRNSNRTPVQPRVPQVDSRPPLWRRLAQKAFLACGLCVIPTICLGAFLGPIGFAVPAGLFLLMIVFGTLGKKG